MASTREDIQHDRQRSIANGQAGLLTMTTDLANAQRLLGTSDLAERDREAAEAGGHAVLPATRLVAEAVRGWRSRATGTQAGRRPDLRLPRRGRGGRIESAETAHKRAALGLAIGGLRCGRPDLGRRGVVGRRHC